MLGLLVAVRLKQKAIESINRFLPFDARKKIIVLVRSITSILLICILLRIFYLLFMCEIPNTYFRELEIVFKSNTAGM